jgi:hypothetical protein
MTEDHIVARRKKARRKKATKPLADCQHANGHTPAPAPAHGFKIDWEEYNAAWAAKREEMRPVLLELFGKDHVTDEDLCDLLRSE